MMEKDLTDSKSQKNQNKIIYQPNLVPHLGNIGSVILNFFRYTIHVHVIVLFFQF